MQVVGWRKVSRICERPGLLEGDTEQRRPSHRFAHDGQVVVNIGPLLDVIRQVEVGIVKRVFRLRRLRMSLGREKRRAAWQDEECGVQGEQNSEHLHGSLH